MSLSLRARTRDTRKPCVHRCLRDRARRPVTIDHSRGADQRDDADGNGATTVRAVRIDAPLRIDGALDEELYRRVAPMTDFIQIEPDDGAVAVSAPSSGSPSTTTRSMSFRVWDSQMDRLVATEMRRDNGIIWSGNDNVVFVSTPSTIAAAPSRLPSMRSAHAWTVRSSTSASSMGTGIRCGLKTGRFDGG
jgi:hypothetical protein